MRWSGEEVCSGRGGVLEEVEEARRTGRDVRRGRVGVGRIRKV
jgi:hypothetical protein